MTKGGDAYVVDVDMGYGHGRAAFALRDLAGARGVISANDYEGMPARDRATWKKNRRAYEILSRLKPVPFIGSIAFKGLDMLQHIPDFYPRRDLTHPSLQLSQTYKLIRRGLGKHLIETLAKDPKPFVSTFFLPAFAADVHKYPGEIYCVVCDADVSRAWAPLDAEKSRIIYLAGNGRVVERLKLYGVPEERIRLTGFPLPKNLVGGPDATAAKDQLADRLCLLDPQGVFAEIEERTLRAELGPLRCHPRRVSRPLTLLYSVGGAGAQHVLGTELLKSLARRIARHELKLILSVGTHAEVGKEYHAAALALGLASELGTFLDILGYPDRQTYFEGFSKTLETVDILWTKPSELSFYAGVGMPIVMAPPIGSQEDFNATWLRSVGAGIPQEDPRYADEWLFDWIASGGLARMAWNGYTNAPTHGTYRIEDVVLGRSSTLAKIPLVV